MLTRLSCPACATELSGAFVTCEFCGLTDEDREVLRVFLASRGNMKELERHLGVSYPTARARFDDLLRKLGLGSPPPPPPPPGGGEARPPLRARAARGAGGADARRGVWWGGSGRSTVAAAGG